MLTNEETKTEVHVCVSNCQKYEMKLNKNSINATKCMQPPICQRELLSDFLLAHGTCIELEIYLCYHYGRFLETLFIFLLSTFISKNLKKLLKITFNFLKIKTWTF